MTYRIALVFLALGLSTTADATNGYFRLGYGANSIAMGGTGTALAQDGLAGATNPATIFAVDQDYTLALSIFNPKRGFEVTGGPGPLALGKVESDSEYFVIPSFGYIKDLNADWVMSITVYGNGGMNTDYNEEVFSFGAGSGQTGVDLTQVFLNTAFAYKLSANTQLGFAPIIALQSFEANGLGNFGGSSQDATKLSNQGHDTVLGYGARLGIAHQINSNIHLGASYQTEINFDRFEDYQGLFAENGDMDIPSTYNLGIAFDNADYTLALDYQVINYSDIASIGNPFAASAPLGNKNGPGFGWNDMNIVKLGGALKRDNGHVVRSGVSYGEQPIDSSEVLFNILAPGVQEWHYTAGYEFGDTESRYTVAFSYSPSKSVKGANPLSPTQYIEIEMEQYEVTFSAAF